MIGLRRHTVQVVDHDPGWAALGAEVCRQVRQAGGDLLADVQHVGSTAVQDLPAKPILDIAAAMVSPDAAPTLIERLTGIGYIYRGDSGDERGHLFVRESSPDVRTVHLHVVEHNDVEWRSYLRFRDVLRRDPAVRRQYAELKQGLATQFGDDRKSYTGSKHDFIRGVLADAEAQPGASVEA